MLKSHIFVMLFVVSLWSHVPLPFAAAPAAPAREARTTMPGPVAFRGLSSSELGALSHAEARLSSRTLSRKGEVAKAESTFRWEYFVLFAVLALGALATLAIA